MKVYIGLFLASLLLISCQSTERELSALSKIEKEILNLRKASNEAIQMGDLEAISSFWVKDVLISTGAGTLLSGSDAVKAYLTAVYEKSPDIVFVRTPLELKENALTEMAWEEGEWKAYLKSKPEEILAAGKYAAAWAKVGEEWKIKSQLFVGL